MGVGDGTGWPLSPITFAPEERERPISPIEFARPVSPPAVDGVQRESDKAKARRGWTLRSMRRAMMTQRWR